MPPNISHEHLKKFFGSDSIDKYDQYTSFNNLNKQVERSLITLGSVDKALSQLASTSIVAHYSNGLVASLLPKSLQELLQEKRFGLEASGLDSVARAFGKLPLTLANIEAERFRKSFASIGQLAKSVDGLNVGATYRDYIKSKSFLPDVALAKVVNFPLAHVQSQNLTAIASANWVSQFSKAVVEENLYNRFFGSLDLRNFQVGGGSNTAAHEIQRQYAKLFSSSRVWAEQVERLQRPEYLAEFLASLEQETTADGDEGGDPFKDFVPVDPFTSDFEIQGDQLLTQLSHTQNPSDFAGILCAAPWWIKWALINFVMYMMLPSMLGISSSLLTPYVKKYLLDSNAKSPREQVNDIRKLAIDEADVVMENYRFASRSGLTVRKTPNSRSNSVAVLNLGQVVAVISASRNWTQITYEMEGEDPITGWVFTRYLEKFRS